LLQWQLVSLIGQDLIKGYPHGRQALFQRLQDDALDTVAWLTEKPRSIPSIPREKFRLWRRVRAAVLVHEAPIGTGTHHVDIRACGEIVRTSRPYLKIDGNLGGPVYEVVAVASALWKRRTISRAQYRLAIIFEKDQLAFQ
jgi:hypothetical protein